jgi:hypothetical protein
VNREQGDFFGHSTWLEQARRAARSAGKNGKLVSIDDVRAVVGSPPTKDPRAMGSVFESWEWEPVDWIKSKRRECHSRPIQRWRLKEEM